jgi:hypothetical protein
MEKEKAVIRVLDQPSETLIRAVEHLIKVETSTENDDKEYTLDDLNKAWSDVFVAKEEAKVSLGWTDEQLFEIISRRILDEHNKYGSLPGEEWTRIAAAKIIGTTRDVLGGSLTLRLIEAGNACALAAKNAALASNGQIDQSFRDSAMEKYNRWMLVKGSLSTLSSFQNLTQQIEIIEVMKEYIGDDRSDRSLAVRTLVEKITGSKF